MGALFYIIDLLDNSVSWTTDYTKAKDMAQVPEDFIVIDAYNKTQLVPDPPGGEDAVSLAIEEFKGG